MNLKTIAEKAGVSTATVSNVINGNNHKVSDETRRKIEQIIKETNYRPSIAARSLVKKETRIIGLVIPYINNDTYCMINPYTAHIVAALEQYVRKRDYYLMLRCVSEVRDILPLLSAWNVDGAVFLGVWEPDVKKVLEGLKSPAVFIDTYTSDKDIVNVGIDDYKGGYLSAKYLISKGHKKIALASPEYKLRGVINERYNGFVAACREAGINFTDNDVIKVNTIYQDAIAAGQDLALSGKGYTAVAAMSDMVAFGLSEGLKQCGIRVPDDVSVIGFDNIPDGVLVSPKLTTIEQDFMAKATKAGDYLFRMIDGEMDLKIDDRLPIRIKERQSVQSIQ